MTYQKGLIKIFSVIICLPSTENEEAKRWQYFLDSEPNIKYSYSYIPYQTSISQKERKVLKTQRSKYPLHILECGKNANKFL